MNPSLHQPPQMARANGIELCYEIFGDPAAEPLILIMGLGAQMIHWDDDFCRQLAARGFRVIRFDNRDIGQSSRLSGGKPLTRAGTAQAATAEDPGQGALPAERHGGRYRRPDGCARHQIGPSGRRFHGRHDRPGDRDLVSATRAFAHLHHVDHRQSENSRADARGHGHPDGAAAEVAGGISRSLRQNLESPARRLLPGRRGA